MTERLERAVPPAVVVLVSLALMKGGAMLLPFGTVQIPYANLGTKVCLILTVLLAGASLLQFWRWGTTADPRASATASTLVTTGVYRVSRNPMYLAMLFVLIAGAFAMDHLAAWAVPPLFVAYMTRFQIRPEERRLAQQFGAPYVAYCQTTRRWI